MKANSRGKFIFMKANSRDIFMRSGLISARGLKNKVFMRSSLVSVRVYLFVAR